MAGLLLGADTPPADKPMLRAPLLLGAHRGGAGLWPENTLVAFRNTAEKWPEALLETDARLTSDGQVVLQHDEAVDRTTDGLGSIAQKTFTEVMKLDAGYRFTSDGGKTFPYRDQSIHIPTLASVLTALPRSRFLVELKDQPGIADAVVRVLREAGAEDRVMIASFKPTHMQRLRELAPKLVTCYDMARGMALLKELRSGDWKAYARTDDILSVEKEMMAQFKITPDELHAIQAKDILVQVHTLDEKAEIADMLRIGVDSILSDYPNRLAEAIAENKKSAGQ